LLYATYSAACCSNKLFLFHALLHWTVTIHVFTNLLVQSSSACRILECSWCCVPYRGSELNFFFPYTADSTQHSGEAYSFLADKFSYFVEPDDLLPCSEDLPYSVASHFNLFHVLIPISLTSVLVLPSSLSLDSSLGPFV
jgi:hypothetical protein